MAKRITEEQFEAVCLALAETYKGIRAVCKSCGTTYDTFKVLLNDKEHYARYVRAREEQLSFLEDELRQLAWEIDNINLVQDRVNLGANYIQQARLKIDSIKFILSKLRSNVWGDKVEVTHKQEPRIFNVDGISDDDRSEENAADAGE